MVFAIADSLRDHLRATKQNNLDKSRFIFHAHAKAPDLEFGRPILVFLAEGTLTDALPSRSKQNTYKFS